jgi:AcrR family transcriptional regulator
MQDVVAKPSRRSQAERSATTSARLIEATISTLHARGYTATSTSLVAELAGVSRGAMLHHFPTKVHLMAATIYAIYQSDIAAYQATILEAGDKNQRLDRLVDTAWACFKSPGGIAQTEIWMATRSDQELATIVLPVHVAIVRQSVISLAAVLEGRLGNTSFKIEHILTYLVSSLRGLSIQHVLGSPEEELVTAIDLIKSTIHALLKP